MYSFNPYGLRPFQPIPRVAVPTLSTELDFYDMVASNEAFRSIRDEMPSRVFTRFYIKWVKGGDVMVLMHPPLRGAKSVVQIGR